MIIIVPSSSCSASSPLLWGHSLEPDMPTPPQLPFSFTVGPQSGTGHAHLTPTTLLLYCPTVWNRTCPPHPNYPSPLLPHSLEPDMPTSPQLPFSFTAPQSGTGHAHLTPTTLLLYCPTVWNQTCPPHPNYPYP